MSEEGRRDYDAVRSFTFSIDAPVYWLNRKYMKGYREGTGEIVEESVTVEFEYLVDMSNAEYLYKSILEDCEKKGLEFYRFVEIEILPGFYKNTRIIKYVGRRKVEDSGYY